MAITSGTNVPKQYIGEYDFAKDAGAVGTITLRSIGGSGPIPGGSVILAGCIEVLTGVASATGTVALQVEAAGDILATVSPTAALTVGIKSVIPAGTGATAVKATVDRAPAMVIATAALTAGKFYLRLLYF